MNRQQSISDANTYTTDRASGGSLGPKLVSASFHDRPGIRGLDASLQQTKGSFHLILSRATWKDPQGPTSPSPSPLLPRTFLGRSSLHLSSHTFLHHPIVHDTKYGRSVSVKPLSTPRQTMSDRLSPFLHRGLKGIKTRPTSEGIVSSPPSSSHPHISSHCNLLSDLT